MNQNSKAQEDHILSNKAKKTKVQIPNMAHQCYHCSFLPFSNNADKVSHVTSLLQMKNVGAIIRR